MSEGFSSGVLLPKRLAAAAMAVFLLLANAIGMAVEPGPSDYLVSSDPALGISNNFGRWDSQINLVYDPDGAPELFADSALVLDLLEEAVLEWEQVSGIRFSVTGVDSNALDDDDSTPNDKDGLVRVYWANTGGAAGRAGPDGGNYDTDRGYYPYVDGRVQLNEVASSWDNTTELVPVLVHELGHLMGLGHSENPDSIMYANPYNHLNHPRADDILAARALYGPGTLSIDDVTSPVSTWLYKVLPTAPASDLEYLFTPNQATDNSAFISVGNDTPLTVIDENTTDSGFVRFNFGGIGNFNNNSDINIDTTIVAVDPFGYDYDLSDWQIECDSGFACNGGWISIAPADVIKTIPGQWTVYVIDDDKQTTLLELHFSVDTSTDFNRGPVADVSVSSVSNTIVDISLEVSDPEGNPIEVLWHPQGNLGDQDGDGFLDTNIVDTASSGDTVSRQITFLTAETHTLYVELRDDQPRYDGSVNGSSTAGDGFQNLLAITVDLPLSSDSDVTVRQSFLTGAQPPVVDTGGGDSDPLTGQDLVNTIAGTSALELITASDGSTSTAQFGAGASSDAGVSTSTAFSNGNDIVIAGSVSPQQLDVGRAGEIYVVLLTSDSLTYMDLDGSYINWTGSLKTIQPAFERDGLVLTENFELFSGAVQSGLYRVFLGYRVTEGGGGPIHFNAKAFRINVD